MWYGTALPEETADRMKALLAEYNSKEEKTFSRTFWKLFYYRGLRKWNDEQGYLTDICLTAQDRYKAYLDYFRIIY